MLHRLEHRITNPHFILVMLTAAVVTLLVLSWASVAAAENIPTALSAEAEVPSFYVRAVTGPLAGKSVCYVCRNGDRPVVVVLLRELNADTTSLLKGLDQTVNDHRAEGLRCFAVLLTETPQRDAARLQTLAFDEKIDLPLTMSAPATTAGTTFEFNRDAAVSVIAYQSRKVTQRFTFKSGECDGAARNSIVAAAKKLIEPAMQ